MARLTKEQLKKHIAVFCEVIYFSRREDDYKYMTSFKIFEYTINYIVEQNMSKKDYVHSTFELKLDKAIKSFNKLEKFHERILQIKSFRSQEAHITLARILDSTEIKTLRNTMTKYLSIFFSEVLKDDYAKFKNDLIAKSKIKDHSYESPELIKLKKELVEAKSEIIKNKELAERKCCCCKLPQK